MFYSAAAAPAHEPRGVRTPRESAPCPRELALRARERDTSPLPRLPTPSVCSAVRVSLCERDEDIRGPNERTLGDGAHRNHAHKAALFTSPFIRASVTHTSCATDVLSRPLFIVPSKNVQVDDGTRTDDGIEFVDELFDQDGRVRFPGRRPGSIPRPPPLNFPSTVPIRTRPLHLDCPTARAHPVLLITALPSSLLQSIDSCDSARSALGSFETSSTGKSGARRARRRASRSSFSHLGAKLTIDEISRVLVVRDGRARYLTRRGS